MTEDIEMKVNAAHWAFNTCGSVRELNRQLTEGLIGSVDHAGKVLEVWHYFVRLPQYADIREHLD